MTAARSPPPATVPDCRRRLRLRPRDRRDDPAVPPRPRALRAPAGAWLKRWGLGLAGWARVRPVIYLTVGEHLNGYLSIAGLMVGFLVGLTGMGGGALMTPVLIFVFGFEPTMAIGTDVTYAAVTKIAGSWKHWRQGSVDIPLALWLALGSVPASLIGVADDRLRQEPLRRPHQRDPLPGHRLRADDGRRPAHREGRPARRRRAPPREHQDDAAAQDHDRPASASAPASSSASRRSAAARCSPCSSSSSIR